MKELDLETTAVDYGIVFTSGAGYTYRDNFDGHTRVYEKANGLVVKVGNLVTLYPWHAIQSVTQSVTEAPSTRGTR